MLIDIDANEPFTNDDLEYFRDILYDECSSLFHHYIYLAKTQAVTQTKLLNQLFKIIEHCSSQEDMTEELYHQTIDKWYKKLDKSILEDWETINKAVETAKNFKIFSCDLRAPHLSSEEYYVSMC